MHVGTKPCGPATRFNVLLLSLGLLVMGTYLGRILDLPTGVLWPVVSLFVVIALPGFILMKLLGKPVFITSGLAIILGGGLVILMILGLSMNTILFSLGWEHPLSYAMIAPSLSGFVVASFILCAYSFRGFRVRLNRIAKPDFVTAFAGSSLVACGAISAVIINLTDTAGIAILFLVGLPIVAVMFSFRAGLNRTSGAIIILGASLGLLLQRSLISSYFSGFDIHVEYYFFREAYQDAYWNSSLPYPSNSSLAITILPTLIEGFCEISVFHTFKVIAPTLCAIVPVLLFVVFSERFGPHIAYFGALLLILRSDFSILPGLVKQEFAMFFMAICILLIFDSRIRTTGRTALLVLMSIGIVISHYSTAFLFIIILALGLLLQPVLNKTRCRHPYTFRYVLILGLVSYAWYAMVGASAAVKPAVRSLSMILRSLLGDFSSSGSIDPYVSTSMDPFADIGLAGNVSRIVQISVFTFLTAGLLIAIFRRNREDSKNTDVKPLMIGAFLLLVPLATIPFAATLNFTRMLLFLMIFFCPLFATGIREVADRIRIGNMTKPVLFRSIAATVLLVSSLFASGVAYHFSGHPSNIVTDPDMDYAVYLPEEVQTAGWLGDWMGEDRTVFGDAYCRILLMGYIPEHVTAITNDSDLQSLSIIFLRNHNIEQLEGDLDVTSPTDTVLREAKNFSVILDSGAARLLLSP